MISEAVAVLCGIEACRRVLARNPYAPVKVVSEPYDFYDASPEIRASAVPAAVWAQLEPGSLAVTVRVFVAPRTPRPPVEAGRWSVPYPTCETPQRRGGQVMFVEQRVDPPAILARQYRETLQGALDRALRVVGGLRAAQTGRAVSHA